MLYVFKNNEGRTRIITDKTKYLFEKYKITKDKVKLFLINHCNNIKIENISIGLLQNIFAGFKKNTEYIKFCHQIYLQLTKQTNIKY